MPGTVQNRTISETEFVSDTFQTNDKDLEEVKAGMKKLGIDTLAQQAGKDGKSFLFYFILFLRMRQTQLYPGDQRNYYKFEPNLDTEATFHR